MSVLNNSNAIESGGYNIDRSLRFRSSASAYLNRTPASAGNRQKFTWSGWVKRGTLGTNVGFFQAGTAGNQINIAFFGADDKIYMHNGVQGVSTESFAVTSAVFRDPSAWYHIVFGYDTTQATVSNRIFLYVNNVQQTLNNSGANYYPSQNYNTAVNNTVLHYQGFSYTNSATQYLDGYLAEVNFIDGQALMPSSFGQTDPVTGVWTPKKYTGTYGTNGFYLDFKDNTSATTLAYDKSGNGNNWTANNISTTAGATYDSMTDVPTLTSATAANYCVLNPLDKNTNITAADGNLSYTTSSAAAIRSTMWMTSGKYYAEFTISAATGAMSVGVAKSTATLNDNPGIGDANAWGYVSGTGNKWNGSGTAYGSSFTTNDVIGVAVDMTAGKIWWSKNGTWQASGDPAAGTNAAFTNLPTDGTPIAFAAGGNGGGAVGSAFNTGQRPFSYTPPTGFKALNTFNLPDPVIKKPNQYMDATTYTGNGATQSIVNAAGFQPDLVWAKARSAATSNILVDAVRGATYYLSSNATDAESNVPNNTITAFNSNGFSVGANNSTNGNTVSLVGWQWKESATAGFDIVTYTGTGVARTVSHSLGVAPKMIIVKGRSNTYRWPVYTAAMGATKFLSLNETISVATDSGYWNNTEPTSSVFSLGTSVGVNENAATYVAYLFAEIAGFSKFGNYTGNGSTDGPFVYCGFRPKYVMVKRTDSTSDWGIYDSSRDTYNQMTDLLFPNASYAETAGFSADFLSNGFKMRNSAGFPNNSGGTFIFMAFAESPFKTSNAR